MNPIYISSKPESPIFIEEWRLLDLEGVVKNYYWISNSGKIKNAKGQLLTPQLINSGYYVYKLYTGVKSNNSRDKYKTFLAHRLVKIVFDPIPNPELYTVNHEDLDHSNNCDYNLTWMTQSENNDHKYQNVHSYGVNNYNSIFNIEQLKTIVLELEKGKSYSEILNIIGIPDTPNNRDYIGNIKRGKTYQREIRNIFNK